MASKKVRTPVLQRFFETSTYSMYVFALEKPLRLVVRNFCLAISRKIVKLLRLMASQKIRTPLL